MDQQDYHKIDPTIIEDPMLDDGYTRKFGAYKPKFHGTTPGYYPFECIDYFYVILMTIFTWGICLPIWYGLIEAAKANSKQYAIVCAVVFVGFYVIQALATYYGGRMKKVIENQMIEDKLKEMQQKELDKQKLLAAI
ncbi:unnamed protein product [Paramecium sonneborni]|uniref:Uncharacterized protein n=1 Tax=Paramecium sonneborni TaxID=65129 RepID=A0A8S1R241_9CILI|nr:unnamed protein product [Paramecium sonneborni]